MAGLVVILLTSGITLLVAELALGTRGVLATAGIAALIAGTLLAALGASSGIAIVLALTAPLVAGLGALALLALRLVSAANGQAPRCGGEGLVGHVGVVRRPLAPLGHVTIDGELWRARRSWASEDTTPMEGEPVVVDRVDGLTLSVRRAEAWEAGAASTIVFALPLDVMGPLERAAAAQAASRRSPSGADDRDRGSGFDGPTQRRPTRA